MVTYQGTEVRQTIPYSDRTLYVLADGRMVWKHKDGTIVEIS